MNTTNNIPTYLLLDIAVLYYSLTKIFLKMNCYWCLSGWMMSDYMTFNCISWHRGTKVPWDFSCYDARNLGNPQRPRSFIRATTHSPVRRNSQIPFWDPCVYISRTELLPSTRTNQPGAMATAPQRPHGHACNSIPPRWAPGTRWTPAPKLPPSPSSG